MHASSFARASVKRWPVSHADWHEPSPGAHPRKHAKAAVHAGSPAHDRSSSQQAPAMHSEHTLVAASNPPQARTVRSSMPAI